MTATVQVGGSSGGARGGLGRVWAGPRRAVQSTAADAPAGDPDADTDDRPGARQPVEPAQFTRLAYDTLVTFEASPGPAGLRLVPDLALSIPAPSDGDTTYTFRLRRGIRYSDGRRCAPQTSSRGGATVFVRSQGVGYYRGLEGADACVETSGVLRAPARDRGGRRRRDGAVPPHRARSELPAQADGVRVLGPIPLGTPDRDVGADAVPGTGPYRIAERPPGGAVLVRNRFFREWSMRPSRRDIRIGWSGGQCRSSRAAVESGAPRPGRLDPLAAPCGGRAQAPDRAAPAAAREPVAADRLHPAQHAPAAVRRRARAPGVQLRDRPGPDRTDVRGGAAAVPTCQTLMPGMLGHRGFLPDSRTAGTSSARAGSWPHPARRASAWTYGRPPTCSGTPSSSAITWPGCCVRSATESSSTRYRPDDFTSRSGATSSCRSTATGCPTIRRRPRTCRSSSAAAAASPTATSATPSSTAG